MKPIENPPAHPDPAEGLFPGFPTLDLGNLFETVIKRGWLAAAIMTGFVLLALTYVLTAQKTYESSALINIESSHADSGVLQGIKGAKRASYDSLDSLKSMAAGLTSGSVILRVIDKLDLRNDPDFLPRSKQPISDAELVKFLGKRLKSELIRGERNIFLRVRDSDPVRAKEIADTLIVEFREMLREQNAMVAEKTRATLLAESEAQAARVDEAELALQRFREQYPEVPLDEDNVVLNGKYADLQAIANRAQDEANRLKAEYEQCLEVRNDPERILEIGTYSGLESIQKLLLARDSKLAEFRKIQQQFTPKHSTYRAFEAEVEGLNARVEEAALALGESIEKRYRSAVERAASARRAVIDQAAANLEVENIRREFRSLNRAREAALATYDRLLERINDSSVARNVDETVIHTFSPPLANDVPVGPKKALLVSLAGVLGGTVGIAVVLLMGLLERTLATKRQVENTLGLSVLAEIPRAFEEMNWDLNESIMVSKEPGSLVSEGFRSLRTSLSSIAPRSVMFVSTDAGEGKSFCAANLAVLQAQCGYRTLIVDADTRNPKMARLFVSPKQGREGDEGLAVQQSCQETVIPNLFHLSLGQFSPDRGEAMSGDHFASMLWEAYSSFDCVIIDSSPLGLVSDGLNFSRYADAVVLVVQSGETDAGAAAETVKDLRRMRAQIAGCVLNGIRRVDPKKAEYVRRSGVVRPQPSLEPAAARA